MYIKLCVSIDIAYKEKPQDSPEKSQFNDLQKFRPSATRTLNVNQVIQSKNMTTFSIIEFSPYVFCKPNVNDPFCKAPAIPRLEFIALFVVLNVP